MSSLTKLFVFDVNTKKLIGILSESEGSITFEYASSYIEGHNPTPLNPIHLPVNKIGFTSNNGLHGLLSTFNDYIPGKWGRAITKSHLGYNPPDLNMLLAYQANKVGSLVFGLDDNFPDELKSSIDEGLPANLTALLDAVVNFEKSEALGDPYRKILTRSAALGGARPKLSMARDNDLYIVKLPSNRDLTNIGQIEHGTMRLAENLGINVAESELLHVSPGRDLFITKRFDVTPETGHKTPYLSMRSLLGVDHSADASYAALSEQLKRINGGLDSLELFDRMIFNLAISNHDDHFLNHAVYFKDGTWRLTPAFDIVAGEGGKAHAIKLGSDGNKPGIENALSYCESFDLTRSEAIERALTIIQFIDNNWQEEFKKAGVDDDVISSISWAILHDVSVEEVSNLKVTIPHSNLKNKP